MATSVKVVTARRISVYWWRESPTLWQAAGPYHCTRMGRGVRSRWMQAHLLHLAAQRWSFGGGHMTEPWSLRRGHRASSLSGDQGLHDSFGCQRYRSAGASRFRSASHQAAQPEEALRLVRRVG